MLVSTDVGSRRKKVPTAAETGRGQSVAYGQNPKDPISQHGIELVKGNTCSLALRIRGQARVSIAIGDGSLLRKRAPAQNKHRT
jgi:hypothetical protein